MPEQASHTVVPFPLARRLVIDTVRVGMRKHHVHGLIEIDVTDARRALREHATRTGEKLSFTAFVIACLGRAVGEHKEVHAYRNRRGDLVIFDDVDVTTLIETDLGGNKFAMAHVLRATNHRTVREISDEIRGVQSSSQRDFNSKQSRFMGWFLRLPTFIRDWFYAYLLSDPFLLKRQIGTVMVTAVGMFGAGGGWGIITPIYNLAITLGGIAEKPGIVAGRIEPREVLSVTITVDHDVIDGAPAARFAARFKQLVESGDGLEEI